MGLCDSLVAFVGRESNERRVCPFVPAIKFAVCSDIMHLWENAVRSDESDPSHDFRQWHFSFLQGVKNLLFPSGQESAVFDTGGEGPEDLPDDVEFVVVDGSDLANRPPKFGYGDERRVGEFQGVADVEKQFPLAISVVDRGEMWLAEMVRVRMRGLRIFGCERH